MTGTDRVISGLGVVFVLSVIGYYAAPPALAWVDAKTTKTYAECVQDASKATTEVAARAYINQCRRFKVTEDQCRADAAVERATPPSPGLAPLRERYPEYRTMTDVEVVHDLALRPSRQTGNLPGMADDLPALLARYEVQDSEARTFCHEFHPEASAR